MLWAASVLCFFGFLRSGEITAPSQSSYNPETHLSWGDVAVDDHNVPTMIRMTLKRSKTDQLGKGAEVFVGKAGCDICPVTATVAYMAARGNQPGPFFRFKDGKPLSKAKFTHRIRKVLQRAGMPYQSFAGHSLRTGSHSSCQSRRGGFCYSDAEKMEKLSISSLHPDS